MQFSKKSSVFEIKTTTDNGIEILVLANLQTGTRVEVVPEFGGILHQFIVVQNGAEVNVIDNYQPISLFLNEAEKGGFKSCKLSPFVCRLKDAAYAFNGSNYRVSKYLSNGHALHGLIYNAAFSVTDTRIEEDCASLALQYSYQGADAGFPFHYHCSVVYTLHQLNRLSITTLINNAGSTAMPVTDGWHPYFKLGGKVDDWQMQFNAEATLEFDEQLLPTGKQRPYSHFEILKPIGNLALDNSFLVDFTIPHPLLTLRNDAQKIQLQIDADESYPILQIYIPEHRQSIAIENLSGAPDAFNNKIGLSILEPGATASFNCSYSIQLL